MKQSIDFAEFQQIAKSVLKRLTDFLDQNHLRYFLGYGTLLGAVRHHDIIPWDYDIDILMPRQDMNALLDITQTQPIDPNLKLYSWRNTRNYYLPFLKVCDTRTRLVITKTQHTHIPLGVWVDIFPLDGADTVHPENTIQIREQGIRLFQKANAPFYATHNWKETVYQIPARIRSAFISSASHLQKASILAEQIPFDDASHVGVLLSIDAGLDKEIVPRNCFGVEKCLFGDYEYTIPSGYDAILKQLYGDYMQLPPEEDRQIPNIQSYWIK